MSRPEDSFSPDSAESMHENQRAGNLAAGSGVPATAAGAGVSELVGEADPVAGRDRSLVERELQGRAELEPVENDAVNPSTKLGSPGHDFEPRRPKRTWRPPHEYDRSMRAYQQNPRALVFACDPCECGGADRCLNCGPH